MRFHCLTPPTILTCVFALAQVEFAGAQAPANDHFANATTIPSLPFSGSGTTVAATPEAGEVLFAGDFNNVASNSVWWTFTAVADQNVSASSSGAAFDNVIAVYTGASVDALTLIAGADVFPAGPETASFDAVAGTTYHIVVDGFSTGGAADAGAFTLIVEEPIAPLNDNFADATDLSATLPTEADGNNVGATVEAGEPDHANAVFGNVSSHTVWYLWQAPVTDEVAFSCHGDSVDVAMAVYTGDSLNALSEVGAADTFGFAGRETAYVQATAGTFYRIAIDVFEDAEILPEPGAFQLRITTAPANDAFANAVDLNFQFPIIAQEGTTVGATAELLEPDHAAAVAGNIVSASVWYRWQSPVGGTIRIEADPLTGDLALAVYTGTSVVDLVEISSADRGGTGAERVYFEALEDQVYFIAVDAFNDVSADPGTSSLGDFILSISQSPANDAFDLPLDLADAQPPISVPGSTMNATSEFQYGEPEHANAVFGNLSSNSVWYRWTASSTSDVTITVANPDPGFDSVLSVYTGSLIDALIIVAQSDAGAEGDEESVSFTAQANQSYIIAVDGYSGDGVAGSEGVFDLVIESAGTAGPYEQWIAGFPSLTGTDAERNASPARDGISNLVKLALGLDPTIAAQADPNRANLPRLIEFGGGHALQYNVVPANLGTGAEVITHGGQAATDLATWSPQASANTVGDTWIIPIPAGLGQARLIVTDPEG